MILGAVTNTTNVFSLHLKSRKLYTWVIEMRNILAPQSNPSIWTLLTASSSFFMSVSSSQGFTSNRTDDLPAGNEMHKYLAHKIENDTSNSQVTS